MMARLRKNSPPAKKLLDAIDLRILEILQVDGRITNQDLSDQVGLSPRPCLERVRRLEKKRFISGYSARIDLAKVQAAVRIVAQIQLADYRRDRALIFERHLLACPEVISFFEVSGAFDYMALMICDSIDAYQSMTASWLDDSDFGIARIVSNVVLRTMRENGPMPLGLPAASDDQAPG